MGAGGFHWTSCPQSGDALDYLVQVCAHRLLFCRGILCGLDNGWLNRVEIPSAQVLLYVLTVQPGSRAAGPLCEHLLFKTLLSPKPAVKSMLQILDFSLQIPSAQQSPSLQVLEPSNDQDHADGIVEYRGCHASQEARTSGGDAS
jgi:hypothetical protein